MDRLYLDANVLFSAAYGSPALSRLWERERRNLCQLLASGYVIEEARRNLEQQAHLMRLEKLVAQLDIVPEVDTIFSCPVHLPAKDRPVLLAAIQARATHLITGDLHHFEPYRGQVIEGVHICTPRDYFRSLEDGGSSR
ncbi:PIN domain-containing protein [Moorella naiadis]|uniref:PIN domain-containing protein n=1 Tax=Moorella naiadis (nom. illeg.) TaxID=3093670 RepID=UPI003D9C80F0